MQDEEFLNEITKIKDIVHNFLLNKNSLDNKIKEKFLKELEKSRYDLFNAIDIINKHSKNEIDFVNKNYETILKNNVLKITIPEVLPKYKNISNYAYKNIMLNVAKSTEKYSGLFKDKLTFVLIVVHENQSNMDIDNKYVKPIIDALVIQNIIQDDNINNMFYMVIGKNDTKTPYTEAFVMDAKYMIDWINNLQNMF